MDSSEEGSDFQPEDEGTDEDIDELNIGPAPSGQIAKRTLDDSQSKKGGPSAPSPNAPEGKRKRGDDNALERETRGSSSRMHNVSRLPPFSRGTQV